MQKGEQLWVLADGAWQEAKYEFRVENAEPLGHHSVYLTNGGGRRVVCSCKTSTVDPLQQREWTPEERDAYYSRLHGDARLVAGLDPEPTQPANEELIATVRAHCDQEWCPSAENNGSYARVKSAARDALTELERRLVVKS